MEELTACLRDEREGGKVDHTLQDLVAQRVFSRDDAPGQGLTHAIQFLDSDRILET